METRPSENKPSSKRKRGDQHDGSITNVTGQQKPAITKTNTKALHDRLRSFIPELADANAKLDGNENSLEVVEEGDAHIDMDLGLGVLQEFDSSEGSTSSSDTSDDEEEDRMQKLMGEKRNTKTEGRAATNGLIQEVDTSADNKSTTTQKVDAGHDKMTSEADAAD